MKRTGKMVLWLMILSLLTGCQGTGVTADTKVVLTTGFEQDEVFRIDEESCRKAELLVYLTNLKNQYEQIYGVRLWEKEANGIPLSDSLKEVALARIAQVKVMKLLAAQKGILLSAEEEEKVKQAADLYTSSLSQEELNLLGTNLEGITSMYQEYALANKLYDHIIKDVNPEISDDEARTISVEQIFLRCYSLNGKGEKVPYSQEQCEEVEQKAREVVGMLAQGEDFTKLSERYSDHQTGLYSFGKGEMEEAFETAAFNLGTGEVSEAIRGEDGYYIIKCISTFNREETEANKINIVTMRKKEVFEQEYNQFLKTLTRNMNEKAILEISVPEKREEETADFFKIYEDVFR